MKFRLLGGIGVLLVGLAVSVPLYAQDHYVVPALIYTEADSERLVDDEVGGEISVGTYLNDSVAIEGRFNSTSFSGIDSLEISELAFIGRWVFLRDRMISPYLLGGVGVISGNSDLRSDSNAAALSYGAGLDWHFGSSRWGLRAEYRVRDSNGTDFEPTDKIASLGLSYAFGSKPAPVVPMAIEAPDSDGDGVADDIDQCPATPTGVTVDTRGCEVDSDGDGVVDSQDRCPNSPAGVTVDQSGCEIDSDGDGVVDSRDECPDTAAGAPVDNRGCEIRGVIRLEGVNFETNSDRLLPEANRVLDQAAATLRKYPDLIVEIAGHTDDTGEASYNLGLSDRRANTVRDYLIAAGANDASLTARGYGETEPVADNASAEGQARNRRVELRVADENQ